MLMSQPPAGHLRDSQPAETGHPPAHALLPIATSGANSVDVSVSAKELLDAVPDVILVIGADFSITYLNAAGRMVFGDGREDNFHQGQSGFDLVHPDDLAGVVEQLAVVLEGAGATVTLNFRVHHYEVGSGWKLVQATAVNRFDLPSVNGIVVSFRDLVREEQMATSAHRLGVALERTSDIIILHEADGTVLHANRAGREFLGENHRKRGWPYAPHLAQQLIEFALPEAKRAGSYSTVVRVDRTGGHTTFAVIVTANRDGSCVISARDISAQKKVEADLAHRASHDALTGLPNRSELIRHLEESISTNTVQIALLFIDLDRFKAVNDSLGHQYGDELLVSVTRRLGSVIEWNAVLGRLGGDEFVVIVTETKGSNRRVQDLASRQADQLHAALAVGFELAGMPLHVTASIGLAVHHGASDGVDLLRQADLAMFQSKAAGRSRSTLFVTEMATKADRNFAIEGELRLAMASGDLYVAYQPIVNASTEELLGFEALVRWRRDGVTVEPGSFLEVAAETDLITQIDTFVLTQACRQIAAWSKESSARHPLTVSVNLSGRQLARPDLVDLVSVALSESGLEPDRLILEITEGTLMTDLAATMIALAGLRRIGVKLAIDDFGIGYSSLSYLQKFQANIVKIDRRFVEHCHETSSDAGIIEAIVSLARAFGMCTVAEGIETQEQLAKIRELGCDAAQGYLVGHPLEVASAAAIVRSGSPLSR